MIYVKDIERSKKLKGVNKMVGYIIVGFVCLSIGACMGMVCTALFCANRKDNWKDEDTK